MTIENTLLIMFAFLSAVVVYLLYMVHHLSKVVLFLHEQYRRTLRRQRDGRI